MTNKDASFLLGACRPGGADSADPEFAEALAQAAADPALKAWLADQHHFDSGVADHLKRVPVPADLRARILTGGRVSGSGRPVPWFSTSRLLAIAAMLLAFAGLGAWYVIAAHHGEGWEDQTIAALGQLLSGKETFDAQSPKVTDLQQWLRTNGSPMVSTLPDRLKGLTSLGCKVTSWHGHPISIICFHGDSGELVHLAMVEKASLQYPPTGNHPIYDSKDGWQMACWSHGNMAMLLVTRGPESQLRAILAMLVLF